MFKRMLAASSAVLRTPSVAVFEQHERNDLGWASLYVLASALVSAVLGALAVVVQRPFASDNFTELQSLIEELESEFGQPIPLAPAVAVQNPASSIVTNMVGTLVGFFVFLAFVYVLGLLLGGTGAFGELAYDVALFWAPLSVASAFLNIFSIGLLACVTGPLSIAIAVYNLYLTFLSVQSGMNLTGGRALVIVLLPVLLALLLFCGLVVLIALVVGAANVE